MSQKPVHAVVLCPPEGRSGSVDRPLLGLTVGERLLSSLALHGIASVAYVGPGPRPRLPADAADTCHEVDLQTIRGAPTFVVVVADTVFDRKLLDAPDDIPDGLPVRISTPESIDDLVADTDGWLSRLGCGHAQSGAAFAIRAVDDESARAARRALLLSLRKPIDGLVSRHLNRHISTRISRILAPTGVRPNTLTVVFMAIGVASGVLAVFAESWVCLVLAGVLFQLQSILDGCDGEIARLTHRFSQSGQWLDTIGDDLTNYAFCLGLAIGQARVLDCPALYAVGGVTLAAQLTASAILYRRMLKLGTGDLLAIPDTVTPDTSAGSDSIVGRAFQMLRALAKRDSFVLIIAALTAAQQPLAAFCVFAAGTYPMLVGVIVNERRLMTRDRDASAVA